MDELLPELQALYGELEHMLDVQLWYPMPLIRTLYNRGDVNDWQARSADPGYPKYMEDNPDPGRIPEVTEPVFAYAGVRHAGRVDVGELVQAFRRRLVAEGRFFAEEFDYTLIPDLLGGDAGAKRGDPKATKGLAPSYDRIICCEGWRARFNPWFNYLPYGGNKGQVLIIRTEAPLLASMFKHRVFLVPFADNTYWIGATSENQFADDQPTEANATFLEDRLREILTVPYEVVAHRAAVRPTVKDRRMFLGTHPDLSGLAIFNGLGTKGASLAPLGSRWLAEHLLEGKAVPKEVDIARFGR